MAGFSAKTLAAGLCGVLLLSACEEGANPFAGLGGDGSASAPSTQTKLVERDVEAPEVFQAGEDGLWDGRPSLGGVWVAYPNVPNPERVIIRNEANGKFVIGALFNRERDNPGPKLQVSSDAASALAMLAGQPTPLNVTALRKEEVPENPVISEETQEFAAAPDIQSTPLEDPLAAAAAAIEEADPQSSGTVGDISPAKPTETVAAAPAPAPSSKPAGNLTLPYIQIGFFSVKANADATAKALKSAGIDHAVREEEARGKTFWRVLAGPSATTSDRAALLEKVKKLGYADAYFVKN